MHIIELKHGALVCGESLEHYGMPRRSGRYKWGSGKNPRAARRSGNDGREPVTNSTAADMRRAKKALQKAA